MQVSQPLATGPLTLSAEPYELVQGAVRRNVRGLLYVNCCDLDLALCLYTFSRHRQNFLNISDWALADIRAGGGSNVRKWWKADVRADVSGCYQRV